jgi:hypothetical protein
MANLKEIIVGREDEDHYPDVFVAIGDRNRWEIVTLPDGLTLRGFLEGLLFTKNTSLENIKNYNHGDPQPAYFNEHYVLPINNQAFEKIMDYLQKYK